MTKDGTLGQEAATSLYKWIQTKCLEIGQTIVGHKVEVWWPGEGMFYGGTVTAFDKNSFTHLIVYDDSVIEGLWLAIESYKDLGMPISKHSNL